MNIELPKCSEYACAKTVGGQIAVWAEFLGKAVLRSCSMSFGHPSARVMHRGLQRDASLANQRWDRQCVPESSEHGCKGVVVVVVGSGTELVSVVEVGIDWRWTTAMTMPCQGEREGETVRMHPTGWPEEIGII